MIVHVCVGYDEDELLAVKEGKAVKCKCVSVCEQDNTVDGALGLFKNCVSYLVCLSDLLRSNRCRLLRPDRNVFIEYLSTGFYFAKLFKP